MAMKYCASCMQPVGEAPFCPHCGWDNRTQNLPHQLPCGTVLGERYLVGRVLGQGGFGITYMGYDQLLDVPVAIKEYYPNGFVTRDASYSTMVTECGMVGSDVVEANRKRFLREAQSLAKLSNLPEVVHVQNFFSANGTAYIVMEYIQGSTLKSYVNQYGRLDAHWVLNILRPAMQALQKVHEAGIVHRDISPDNIMVMPDGRVKLLDFGAVRDYGLMVTHNTQAVVKPGFAPPEQYQHSGNIGSWTDVYAMCATLYYCMTGMLAPDAPKRMMENIHPDFTQIPGLNPRQIQILERGMALRYSERIQTVAELEMQMYAPAEPAVNSKVQKNTVVKPTTQRTEKVQTEENTGISQEAMERAREWHRQREEERLRKQAEQEQARRIAEAREQRHAEALAQQRAANKKNPSLLKRILMGIGIAVSVPCALFVLLVIIELMKPSTWQESAQPETSETQPQISAETSGEQASSSIYTQSRIHEMLNAIEPHGPKDDTFERYSCEVAYRKDGMDLLAPGLHLLIEDNRNITIDIGGLNIQDYYVIDYNGAQAYYEEASWAVILVSDSEEYRISMGATTTDPGHEKRVTVEDMSRNVSMEVTENKNEAISTIDVFSYHDSFIHWELDMPLESEFEYNAGTKVPFNFSQFHTIYVSATDRYNEMNVTRVYELEPNSAS